MDAGARAGPAERIRAGIEGYFKTYGTLARYQDLRVEERDGRYAVEIVGIEQPVAFAPSREDPAMTVVASHLAIDRLAFVATPEGEHRYRITDVELPAAMPVRESAAVVIGTVRLGLKRASGLFSSRIQNFLEYDVLIEDAAFEELGGGSARLAELTLKGESSTGTVGRTNLAGVFRGSGLDVRENGGVTLAVDEISGSGEMRGTDLEAYGALVDRLRDEFGETASEQVLATAGFVVLGLPKVFTGFGGTFNFRGLAFTDPDPEEGFAFEIGEQRSTFSVADLDKPLARAELGFALSGLTTEVKGEAGNSPLVNLAPETVSLRVMAERLPHEVILGGWAELIEAAAGAQRLPAAERDTALELAQARVNAALLAALLEARSVLRLADTTYASRAVRILVAGSLTADQESAMGGVGSVDLQVRGIDNLLNILAATDEPGTADFVMAMILSMRGRARQRQEADGSVTDLFSFELTPTGQVLLNGAPLKGFGIEQQ